MALNLIEQIRKMNTEANEKMAKTMGKRPSRGPESHAKDGEQKSMSLAGKGEVEDLGKAVVEPFQKEKDSASAKSADKIKDNDKDPQKAKAVDGDEKKNIKVDDKVTKVEQLETSIEALTDKLAMLEMKHDDDDDEMEEKKKMINAMKKMADNSMKEMDMKDLHANFVKMKEMCKGGMKEGSDDDMDAKSMKGMKKKKMFGGMKEMDDDDDMKKKKMPMKEMSTDNMMTKPKTISAMKNMFGGMKEMDMKTIKAAYSKMKEMCGKEVDEEFMSPQEKMEYSVEQRLNNLSFEEDVSALVSGEDDLSEEFKDKAKIIFEAAIRSKIKDVLENVELEKYAEINENSEKTQEDIIEHIDRFLSVAVLDFVKENQLEIESGIQNQIAEDFMTGLKGLFEEHYLEIPETKKDVVAEQAEKIDELLELLNNEHEDKQRLFAEWKTSRKDTIIAEVCEDMTMLEREQFSQKFKGGVEYENDEDFKTKISTLKENYFPSEEKVLSEQNDFVDTSDGVEDEENKEIPEGKMGIYLDAISQQARTQKPVV